MKGTYSIETGVSMLRYTKKYHKSYYVTPNNWSTIYSASFHLNSSCRDHVVSEDTTYSDDPSSNPAEVYHFNCVKVAWKELKWSGVWPIFNKAIL